MWKPFPFLLLSGKIVIIYSKPFQSTAQGVRNPFRDSRKAYSDFKCLCRFLLNRRMSAEYGYSRLIGRAVNLYTVSEKMDKAIYLIPFVSSRCPF